jgi:hypothetical protein
VTSCPAYRTKSLGLNAGAIIWDSTPLEYAFRKRADLSSQVWAAVAEEENKVLGIVYAGRSMGRDVKDIARDLETFISYPDGGARVLGRWGKLEPGDAEYVKRFGQAGIDYRTMRIMRTETAAMLADEQADIARDSDISDGMVDWVLEPGRDGWNCRCAEVASLGPYHIDELGDAIPLHPNCNCTLRPHLKTDEELLAEFEREMEEEESAGEEPEPELEKEPERDIPDVIEETLGVQRGEPIEPREALRLTNRHFSDGRREYMVNCQRCVPTYELRRRGYNVEAMPAPKENSLFGFEGFEGAEVFGSKELGGDGTLVNKKELIRRLALMPDGARTGVIFEWAGDKKEGHTIVCEKINGVLHFIDPQRNIPDRSAALDIIKKNKGFSYYRMDNLEFKDIFQDYYKKTIDWSSIAKKVGK